MMRTHRIKRARIPYTWSEIISLLFIIIALVAFAYSVGGCLFMGAGVPHNEYRARIDAGP